MSTITAYDHTSFTVVDLDGTVAFWRDVMGFEVSDVSARNQPWLGKVVGVAGATCRIAHLSGFGLHLELIAYDDPNRGANVFGPANNAGAAHLAFHVDDLHAFSQRMLEHGASMLGDISFCGDGHAGGCEAVYIKDPAGIIVELVGQPSG